MVGKTNAQEAAFYQQQLKLKGIKLDAQLMAVPFGVYVTKSSLAGSAAVSYGFMVHANVLGEATLNVGSNGAVFGVANCTSVRVIDLLYAADTMSINGVLYSGNAALRVAANVVFDSINNTGDIGWNSGSTTHDSLIGNHRLDICSDRVPIRARFANKNPHHMVARIFIEKQRFEKG